MVNGQALQNLIIIAIFKVMALRDTLVYDSDNWSTYYFWFALSSGVFCFCVCPSFIGAVLSVIRIYMIANLLFKNAGELMNAGVWES